MDSMQLGGILGTYYSGETVGVPDKPELYVLAETLGMLKECRRPRWGRSKQQEHLPGFERLHEHEEGDRFPIRGGGAVADWDWICWRSRFCYGTCHL
jgi:hypothetical protein